jgi:thiol-disulfide isomerase/thioredoxin
MTLNLKSQNQTPYLISKLQPIKGASGETVKLFTTLNTGVDTIRISFMIDLQATKHKYCITANIQNEVYNYYINLSQKADIADFVKNEIEITFKNSTKKISLEVLYSSTLNEIRYIWINNNQKSQSLSIVSIDKPLVINKPFPDLTFTQLDGKTITTKDLAGKCFIINTWFVECPPCRKEIPYLNKLVEKYKNNKEIIFIAIASDRKEGLENYLTQNKFNYIQTLSNSEFDKIFGIEFPTNIVVNPKGIIKYYSEGENDKIDLEIEKAIEKIAKEN